MSSSTPPDNPQWWPLKGGGPTGPFTTAYIHLGLRTGATSQVTQLCPVGGAEWRNAHPRDAFRSTIQVKPRSASATGPDHGVRDYQVTHDGPLDMRL
jgi:hypothetical protein